MQAYRSKAIELEVRLREQLADNCVQGGDGLQLPPSAALLGGMDSDIEVPTTMTAPKLQVYSDLFEAIIESDDAFAPLLQKVKAVYDACAEPLMQDGRARQDAQDGSSALDTDGRETGGNDRLAELALDNRLLRKMAGRLHVEREQVLIERG